MVSLYNNHYFFLTFKSYWKLVVSQVNKISITEYTKYSYLINILSKNVVYSNLKFLIVYSSFVLQNAFHSSVEKCFLIWSGILVFTSTFVRIINLSLIEWCKISFWIQFYRISNYLILPFSSFTNDICAASSKHFIYKLKVKSSFAKEKYSLFPWKKIIVREYQSMNFCL